MKKLIIWLVLTGFYQAVSAQQEMTFAVMEIIESKAFSSQREYYVHLPESYGKEQNRKYPVLYVLHGQWDLLSTVAVVDAISDTIPELIIIGINGKKSELRPPIYPDGSANIEGQKFKSFLVDELLPHIKKSYRVAQYSILSGHSNAGRFVLNAFLDNSQLFNAYFAFSPSLDDGAINKRVMDDVLAFTNSQATLIITLANEGKHMQVPYAELTGLFEQTQPGSTEFFHQEFPEQSHAATKIVSMLFSLGTLFDGWQPAGAVQREGLAGLKTHYAGLTEKYGFNVEIPLNLIARISYFASASDKEEDNRKAAELVKFSLDRDPDSINDFIEVVEFLNIQGQEAGAKRLTASICENLSQHEFCAGA